MSVLKSKSKLTFPNHLEGEIMLEGIRLKNGRYYMAKKIKGKFRGPSLKAAKGESIKALENFLVKLKEIERGETKREDKVTFASIEVSKLKFNDREQGIYDANLIPFFKDKALGEIDDKLVLEYVAAREELGRTKSTLEKELRVLKRVVRLVKDSFKSPEKIAYKNKGNKTARAIRLPKVKEVLPWVRKQSKKYGDDYARVYQIMALTGMDIKDVVYLEWKNIERVEEGYWIRASRFKTGIEFDIPAGPRLVQILNEMGKVRRLDGFVFKTGKGKSGGINNKAVSKALSRAFKDAGVKGSAKSLRHFFASWLSARGDLTDSNVAKMLGHAKGSRCTAGYIHTWEEDLEAGIEKAFAKVGEI